jgi:transposase
VRARRAAWRADQPALDPGRLVFVDETWASTSMTRRYGRSPKSQRLVCPVPQGHWQTTTFVAALRADGLTAPMVMDGAINGELFVAYVEQVLVPSLRPGDVVVLDNLSGHKRAGARQAIEAAGCRLLYLPPYSPDLNPIELAFAQLKALLRSAGERTVVVPGPGPRCLLPGPVPELLPPLRLWGARRYTESEKAVEPCG